MYKITKLLILMALFSLALTACGSTAVEPAAAPPPDDAMMDNMDDTMMDDKDDAMMDDTDDAMMDDTDDAMMDDKDDALMDDMDDAMMDDMDDTMMDDMDDTMMDDMDDTMMDDMDDMDDAMMDTPDWFKAILHDANSGESFAINDFKGKVILVETMAVWCSKCLKQQQEVQTLHTLLADRDDFVSLALNIDPHENNDVVKSFITRHGFNWLYAVAPVDVSREIAQLYGNQFLNPPSTPMFIIDRQGQVHLLSFGVKSARSLQESLEPFLNDDM